MKSPHFGDEENKAARRQFSSIGLNTQNSLRRPGGSRLLSICRDRQHVVQQGLSCSLGKLEHTHTCARTHTETHTQTHTDTDTHTLLIHTRTHGHTHRYTWTQTHTHTINTHIHTHTLSLLIPETRAPDHSEREEPAREGRHLLGARAAVQRRQTLHSPDTRSLLPLPSSLTGCQPVPSHAQHPPAWTGLDTLCPSLFTTVPPSFPPGNIAPGPE